MMLHDSQNSHSISISSSNPKLKHNQNPDLNDESLIIDIPDALSEKDGVKFTIHTRTNLTQFHSRNFSVIRDHDDFIWLHDRFEENANYAGFIIPPTPPRPNFDTSREKLQKLSEGEGIFTDDEYNKMKQELEAEYLAAFKKTVAMHEVFLTRLAMHSVFQNDSNFQVFLEYETDLCAKPKSKMETVGGFLRSLETIKDDYFTNGLKDFDDFFQKQKVFLNDYYYSLKDCTFKIDKMTDKHKDVADCYLKIANQFIQLSTIDPGPFDKFLTIFSDLFGNVRKLDRRVACDEDLKLGDTLRYYQRDSHAAKELLIRRLRCLSSYESANKALDKARSRNKSIIEVQQAEAAQNKAFDRFNSISTQAKDELIDFRNRCLFAFQKSLLELAELEVKHATSQRDLYQKILQLLEETR